MTDNGKITNAMDTEYTLTKREPDMKAIGKTTLSLDRELKLGLKVAAITVSMKAAKSKGMELTNGLMDLNTRETGSTTESME